MTSPIDYELASHPAAVMSGNVFSEKNHGILFGEATCVSIETQIACWTFISSTSSKVARLATMPVLLDGQKPAPIIPEDMSSFVALPTLTFHDDVRHIEFTYPGSFASSQPRIADAIAKKAEEAPEDEKQAFSCLRLMLSTDELEDNYSSNIAMWGFSSTCLNSKANKSDLRDFFVGVGKGLKKSIHAELGKPVSYSLAGHDAFFFQGTISPGASAAKSILVSCSVVAADIVCWQITSTELERVRALSASTVSFDRQLGVPLIPKNLLEKSTPK